MLLDHRESITVADETRYVVVSPLCSTAPNKIALEVEKVGREMKAPRLPVQLDQPFDLMFVDIVQFLSP